MTIFSAIFLGIVQGLTEFFPVSSSGHLVVAQYFIPGFAQPGVLFDVFLHFGTTLAVIIFYWKRILHIITRDLNYIWLLIIGTIPAVLAGIFFGDLLENLFSNTKSLGFQFLITGIIVILTDKFSGKVKKIKTSSAFLIGISQAFAIIPAISRSGSTIFTASALGIDKKKAAEYSFLLSIPAILGANVFEIVKYGADFGGSLINYFAGFFASLVFGYLSIKVVLSTLHERKFKYFGMYCIFLGIFVFLFVR